MIMNDYFNPQDTPNAKWGMAYVTRGGNRYSFFNAKKVKVNANVSTKKVPIIGRTVDARKATSMEIKITMTIYKCSEHFDDIVTEFKKTGVLPTFDLQVDSDDPAAAMGRTSKTYKDCIIDGDVLLSLLDADDNFIEQEVTAYATDYMSTAKYTPPEYMGG